jgi:hypothetical protein
MDCREGHRESNIGEGSDRAKSAKWVKKNIGRTFGL